VSIADAVTTGQEFGRFAAQLRSDGLPPEVLEKLRCNLLHDLSCAMAAHTVGAELWGLARDRRPAEATLLCDGQRVPAENAAFANGALMHSRAQDDTHFAAKTHVGSAVIPAALAMPTLRSYRHTLGRRSLAITTRPSSS